MDMSLYSRVLVVAYVVDLDDPNIWAKCLQERAQFLQRAIPMAMENLFIT